MIENIWRVDGFNITGCQSLPKTEEGTIKYSVDDKNARAYIVFGDNETIFFIQEQKILKKEEWAITDIIQLNWQGTWKSVLFSERGWDSIAPKALRVLEDLTEKFLEQKGVAEEMNRIDLNLQAREEVLRIEQRQEEMDRA